MVEGSRVVSGFCPVCALHLISDSSVGGPNIGRVRTPLDWSNLVCVSLSLSVVLSGVGGWVRLAYNGVLWLQV